MTAIQFGIEDFFYTTTNKGSFCGLIQSIVEGIDEKTFSTICIIEDDVEERYLSYNYLIKYARKLNKEEIDLFWQKINEIKTKAKICKQIKALKDPLTLLQIELLLKKSV